MTKPNKIDSIINEMHKDQIDMLNLLKLNIGMETLGLCIHSLDPDDKNYEILHEYLLARMQDLDNLSKDTELLIL